MLVLCCWLSAATRLVHLSWPSPAQRGPPSHLRTERYDALRYKRRRGEPTDAGRALYTALQDGEGVIPVVLLAAHDPQVRPEASRRRSRRDALRCSQRRGLPVLWGAYCASPACHVFTELSWSIHLHYPVLPIQRLQV